MLISLVGLSGCSSEAPTADGRDPAQDSGGAPSSDPVRGEDTGVACETDYDCSDGAFCNGVETCFEGTCHLGQPPNCDDGIDCTVDSCSHAANNCVFRAPDEDGDGHTDAHCLGPDDAPLGDDCDDEDPDRYPGNFEVCSPEDPSHDEDCNPETYGAVDSDLDGVVSDACCNLTEDGDSICGEDCDDDDYRRYPSHVEICDNIDNDCDGEVDVNTSEVPWYPDEDGDNFGKVDSDDSVLSCVPVEGYSLRPSDCDDGSAAVHIAAVEECDGFDNDCDGDVDEDGVCACAPSGNARPCACGSQRTGIQICTSGLWGTCDCDECVDGEMDCVAGILPRVCSAGRWEFLNACTGQFSECNDGVCTCPGGGMDCVGGAGGGTSAGGASGTGGIASGLGGTSIGGQSQGGQGGSDGGVGTTTGLAPIVISSTPASSTTGYDVSSSLTVTFDQDMDGPSLSSAGLYDAWNAPVVGNLSVSGNVLTFTPDEPLEYGMPYTFPIPAGAKDLDGELLASAFTLEFSTELAETSVPLTVDSDLNYNEGRLSMSPAGYLTAILREEDTLAASERAVALDWTGISFGPAEQVSSTWPVGGFELAADDSGWVMATGYDGANLGRYDRQGAGWVGPSSVTSVSGATTRNLVAVNGSGRGFFVFENSANELEIRVRQTTGTYQAPVSYALNTGGDTERAISINEAGDGLLTTLLGTTLWVVRSGADLTGWTTEVLEPNIWDQDSAVGPNGELYVAYSQNGFGQPLDQVFVRLYDGGWQGAIDVITGTTNGDEYRPQIGVDDVNDVTVAFVKNGHLQAARMTSGSGVFSPAIGFSLPTATVDKHELEVAKGGDVVLAYTQTEDGTTDLWAVRYRAGSGWQTPGLLEDGAEDVVDFDLAIDEAGNAYVLFERTEMDGNESYLIRVP